MTNLVYKGINGDTPLAEYTDHYSLFIVNYLMHPSLIQTLTSYSHVILVGGGTGGHIQPIVSLVSSFAKELSTRYEETGDFALEKIPPTPLYKGGIRNFLWIGGKNSSEEKTAKEQHIQFASISTLKLSTTRSPRILLYPYFLLKGILETRKIISSLIQHSNIPTLQHSVCLFSKGGPGSVAIGIAAWSLSIPIYIHESDTIPGRSNRILAQFATKIWLGFESAIQYFDPKKCEVIGQILGTHFSKPSKTQHSSIRAFEHSISWKTTKPHILVICGSQGARAIFEAIIEQFSGDTTYEWIISLGKLNNDMKIRLENSLSSMGGRGGGDIQALEWISQGDIAHLLSDTDLAITRGSATTLAEIDTYGVRKIIVPLPHAADNHQYYNAREYEKQGDILLEQRDLHKLREILTRVDTASR